jgi:hypothetical protein
MQMIRQNGRTGSSAAVSAGAKTQLGTVFVGFKRVANPFRRGLRLGGNVRCKPAVSHAV